MRNNSKYYYVSNENMSEQSIAYAVSRNPLKRIFLITPRKLSNRCPNTMSLSLKTFLLPKPINCIVRILPIRMHRKRVSSHHLLNLIILLITRNPSKILSLKNLHTLNKPKLMLIGRLTSVSRSGRPFRYLLIEFRIGISRPTKSQLMILMCSMTSTFIRRKL